jgi:hypothetical protein
VISRLNKYDLSTIESATLTGYSSASQRLYGLLCRPLPARPSTSPGPRQFSANGLPNRRPRPVRRHKSLRWLGRSRDPGTVMPAGSASEQTRVTTPGSVCHRSGFRCTRGPMCARLPGGSTAVQGPPGQSEIGGPPGTAGCCVMDRTHAATIVAPSVVHVTINGGSPWCTQPLRRSP